jgi:hypothetical protein
MLAQDVHYHRAQLDGTWSAGEEVTVRLVGRYWAYTDDNTRVDLTANLAYELPWVRNLQALYRLTLADTANEEPGYYTPQQLVQNQVGLEYLWKPSDDFAWRFRYLPGYGFEQGGDGRFVHALHTDLLIRDVLTLDVRPVLDYQQTPTYNLFRFLLLFERSF